MADNQNNPKQECKCDKKIKALEKQLNTFRKVLTK